MPIQGIGLASTSIHMHTLQFNFEFYSTSYLSYTTNSGYILPGSGAENKLHVHLPYLVKLL